MKRYGVQVTCSRDGCESEIEARGETPSAAKAFVLAAGWRLGATRDICPACYQMGHRP